jgi:hypothetical protein
VSKTANFALKSAISWSYQSAIPVRPKLGPSATYRRPAPRQPFEHRQHDIWPKREEALTGGHAHTYDKAMAMI